MLSQLASQLILQRSGGFCGDDCSDAEGYICGNGCDKPKPTDGLTQVDVAGNVLQPQDFGTIDAMDGALALTNAARAYSEVFAAPNR